MPDPVVSPPGSSAGWQFDIWLSKNKDRVKQIISLFSGALTAVLAAINIPTTGTWAPLIQAAIGASGLAVSLLTRLACDWIDYRYTNQSG